MTTLGSHSSQSSRFISNAFEAMQAQEGNAFPCVFCLTGHGRPGLRSAVGFSRSSFRNRPASLIHDSCSHWWVCILCWLSTCNIYTARTTASPSLFLFSLYLKSLSSSFLSVCSSHFIKIRRFGVVWEGISRNAFATLCSHSSPGSMPGFKLSPPYKKAGIVEL